MTTEKTNYVKQANYTDNLSNERLFTLGVLVAGVGFGMTIATGIKDPGETYWQDPVTWVGEGLFCGGFATGMVGKYRK